MHMKNLPCSLFLSTGRGLGSTGIAINDIILVISLIVSHYLVGTEFSVIDE